jgi:hypothetical protein
MLASRRAYVETTVFSYLTARPSRDLVIAAHQQVTQEWWNARDCEVFASQFVVDEAAAGDEHAVARRLLVLRDIPLLDPSLSAATLAMELVSGGGLPQRPMLTRFTWQ